MFSSKPNSFSKKAFLLLTSVGLAFLINVGAQVMAWSAGINYLAMFVAAVLLVLLGRSLGIYLPGQGPKAN